ncbi:hypothetical protein MJ8_29230 [Mesorhizobium sp. J8]|nr:hypothetical protein MJ8_29230 [Mesorhizobium sp. J8]
MSGGDRSAPEDRIATVIIQARLARLESRRVIAEARLQIEASKELRRQSERVRAERLSVPKVRPSFAD